eukprot:3495756-Amphidinium_carterae.1
MVHGQSAGHAARHVHVVLVVLIILVIIVMVMAIVSMVGLVDAHDPHHVLVIVAVRHCQLWAHRHETNQECAHC